MNATDPENAVKNHFIVSHDEWVKARKALLQKEKELTHLRDRVSEQRRQLPWENVEKTYSFETPEGKKSLAELFDGRSQLLIYHFMLPPDSDHICPGCSFLSDHIDAARQHFENADLSFTAVSRARLARIEEVRKRMGWKFRWISSFDTDFNFDYHVSFKKEQIARGDVEYNYEKLEDTEGLEHQELPGFSVFYKDEGGAIYHTYSGYARAGDILIGALNFLDHVPKGRNETSTMSWVRLHDEYGKEAHGCCH